MQPNLPHKDTYTLSYASENPRTSRHDHLKLKIGVAGASETGGCGIDALDHAKAIGREIIRNGGVLLTGTSSGFPLWAAMGAKEEKGIVIGLSPAAHEEEHKRVYRMPTEYTDLIIYTGFGEPGRDILFSRSADAIIVGCGRVGTLAEFTAAFQEGKPIGVLEGKGSIAPMVKEIMQQGEYPTNSIIFDEDPVALVSKIFALIKQQKETRKQ